MSKTVGPLRMTVSELIVLLQAHDGALPVLVECYHSGYTFPVALTEMAVTPVPDVAGEYAQWDGFAAAERFQALLIRGQ